MAYVSSLETQLDDLKGDIKDVRKDFQAGLKEISEKFDRMVPRSELDLVCENYNSRLTYIERSVNRLDGDITTLRRLAYVAAGAGIGAVPVSSAVSLLG